MMATRFTVLIFAAIAAFTLDGLTCANAGVLLPGSPGLFGHAMDMHGDFMVVGAPQDDARGNNSGAIYIYRRENGVWRFFQKTYAPDSESGDQFGYSIAINNHIIAVGAIGGDADSIDDVGAAYVFQQANPDSEWVFLAKVFARDAKAGNRFGQSVDIYDPSNYYTFRLLVGDPYNDNSERYPYAPVTRAGAAYEFEVFEDRYDAWGYRGQFIAPASVSQPYAQLGFSVKFMRHSDTAYSVFLGAPTYDKDGVVDSGAVFKCQDAHDISYCWNLGSPSPQAGAQFGRAIETISGNYLIVGEPYRDGTRKGANTGSVHQYSYDRDGPLTWLQSQHGDKIAGITANSYFGYSLAGTLGSSIPTVAVGAPGVKTSGVTTGGVFLTRFSFFAASSKQLPLYGLHYNAFVGGSVAIQDDDVATGAPRSYDYSGRVHVVERWTTY